MTQIPGLISPHLGGFRLDHEGVLDDRDVQLAAAGGRRPRRFLSPSQRYEIWIGLLRGEYMTMEAAA
jgi:hypothetical protein